MRRNLIETVLGAVVLLIALLFLGFAYQSAKVRTTEGYEITAGFSNVGGLQGGADVRLSGVKIGNVKSLTLDEKTFRAVVTMVIQPDVKLPRDSSAGIASPGLLGDSYVNIIPGGDEENLANGDNIGMTQPSVDLVDMLGKFIFSVADSKKDNGASHGSAAPAGAAPLPNAAMPAIPSAGNNNQLSGSAPETATPVIP